MGIDKRPNTGARASRGIDKRPNTNYTLIFTTYFQITKLVTTHVTEEGFTMLTLVT